MPVDYRLPIGVTFPCSGLSKNGRTGPFSIVVQGARLYLACLLPEKLWKRGLEHPVVVVAVHRPSDTIFFLWFPFIGSWTATT